MSPEPSRPHVRAILASLLPLAACALQTLCWPVIRPFVWFLFYPVVFFSSWVGGMVSGLVATVLSTGLVWWFFMEPAGVLLKPRLGTYLNAMIFMGMGFLFSYFHHMLRRARSRAAEMELRAQGELLDRTSRLAKVGGWEFQVPSFQGSWTEEVARIHDLDPMAQPTVEMGLQFYHEDDRPVIAEAVRQAVEEGRPYDLELRLVSAKGTTKWIRTQGWPMVEGGRVARVQGTLQDITDRKMAELALREINASLERRVEERTGELLGANQELESFAYAVSHDLRAPLRAMGGFSQALQEDCGGTLTPQGMGYLDQIILASRRMGGLIDGLLLLSRSTRGDMERVGVDLSALAMSQLQELARAEPQRNVHWTVAPGIHAQGDPRMLESVLDNLLGNAWKYTSRVPEGRIHVDAVGEGGLDWFRVADNGCGFDMAHSSKLFQPFQRLHRQDEFPGLGIGLATVQRIIQRHGGRLRAVSSPGQGATFQVSLPTLAFPEAP